MSTITDLDKFLSVRPRSVHEIVLHLGKKGIDETQIQEIIKKLEKLKLVNDLEFAQWWVSQRKTFRPRSLRLIKLELRQKGIAKEIIDSLTPLQDESQDATRLLAKKWPAWIKFGHQKAREKAVRYLSSRGYNWDIAKDAIDQVAALKVK